MLEIQHPQEPESLAKYRAEHPVCGSPKKAWDDFHRFAQPVYYEVKNSLVDMQRGLCVYCERRLDRYPSSIIEHIEPRSENPNLVFAFTNLSVCCSGDKPPHCGDSKKNHKLDIKPGVGCNESFCMVTSTGKLIHSRPELRSTVIQHVSFLSLNTEALKQARKDRIDKMQAHVEELMTMRASENELANYILSEYEAGEFPSCVRQVFARFFA